MSSSKKNFIYNLIYQILILIIPLITTPYLSRVVGAEGVGIYSYTYSIVYYFMLLTLLGVNNYGNRTIAKVRDDKKSLSKNFLGIYFFQLIMGILMSLIYLLYISFLCNDYKNIAIIQFLYIISAILDINWFFFGIEEFKKTITRNTFVKISSVILIFLFVKGPDDLWKYTIIMSGMTCLSQIILWFFLKNKIDFVKINIKDILKHVKQNLILFVPVIAVSLYKMMDKIMLGSLSNVTEVAFYENAEKIVNIPMTLITALGTVMLPRMSNIVANGEKNKIKNTIEKSEKFVLFMSFAMCFGLIGIGYNFASLYFGIEFQKTGTLIMMLSATLPFLAFANVLRTQYLIPNEMDKEYIISVSLGAIINLIMNAILIPKFSSVGACVGTICAEATVAIYQSFALRKELKIIQYLKNGFQFFVKSCIMFIVIYVINYVEMNAYLRLILQVIVGTGIYCLLNLKYINSNIDIKKLVEKIRNRNYLFNEKV